jgi:hypothetical protein
MTNFRKAITATLAALTLGVTMMASASPASARGFHHGWGWGPAAAVGLGALAIGAIAASSGPAYASDCYIARRPVLDPWGNVVGYRRVRFCD